MKNLLGLLLLFFLSSTVSAQRKVNKIPDILSEKHWAYIPKKVDLTKSNLEETETKKVEKGGFYISRFEVSVNEYRRFLRSLPEGELEKHKPNSEGWTKLTNAKGDMVKYYQQHQAFDNYPVVNVTRENAEAFAAWLGQAYNSQKKRKFKKVRFRLPTETEWEVAARGEYPEKVIYPWGSPYIRDKNGRFRANILRLSGKVIKNSWDENGNPKAEVIQSVLEKKDFTLTSLIGTYPQTQFGLHDIIGNVAEITVSDHPDKKGALISKGGSFALSEYWAQIDSQYPHEGSNAFTGFRLIMEVIEQ